MKNKKIIFNKKRYLKLLIITIFMFYWIIGSLVYDNRNSFTVLEYSYRNPIITHDTGKLLKGKKITGEFISKDNHLGIVTIRFNNYVKPDYAGEDVLSFRIREKGLKDWYYFNNYRSGLVERQLLFPFGFPVVADSKSKVYEFEVASLLGNNSNAVEISNNQPVLKTSHQFPEQEIVGSKKRIIFFAYNKFITSFSDIDFLLSSVLFMLPLIFYLLWILILRKMRFMEKYFAFLTLLLIILDIFLIKTFYLGIFIGLLSAWIMSIKFYKLESSVSLFNFIFLLFLWSFILFFNKFTIYSEGINLWAYSFLFIGILQLIIEEKRKKIKLIDYKEFFSDMFRFK